jgi:putative oxidoreductase
MIGQPLARFEDERLLTGKGCFADDLQREGQAWCAIVRSPRAHARIVSIDKSKAGCLAVLTAGDYMADGLRPIDHIPNPLHPYDLDKKTFADPLETPQWPLAQEVVRHVGEPVEGRRRRRRRSRHRGGDECDLQCARRRRAADARDAGKALGDPAQQGIIEKEEGKTMSTMMTPTYNPMLPLAGRLLIAAIFLVAGIRKVLGFAGTVGYFTKLGFPAAEAFAVIAIIIELGGAILLIAGWRTRWVAWLLVLFVAIATAMAHRFWEFDAAQQANQLNHFLKNVAIIGGLLFVAGFGPGRASIDKV